jgi:hypothetical protein
MTKKVIFLGAGASKDATYPLTADLYNTLRNEYRITPDIDYKKRWIDFEKGYRKVKYKKEYKNCKDLEILITVMVSCLHSCSAQRKNGFYLKKGKGKYYSGLKSLKTIESLRSIYQSAIDGFTYCISSYFSHKNYSTTQHVYGYLLSFFKKILSDGDVIITVNYDLLAERCLTDLNLWDLHDGYGFEVKLTGNNCRQNSRVKLFKLHGSVGWLENSGNNIIIDTNSLQHISSNEKDSRYQPGDHENKYLILPTFIKNYKNENLLQVWSQASFSLQEADLIYFIGFSLPEYDINIRTLLLPLKNRISQKACDVKIFCKKNDKSAIQRWNDFIGKENKDSYQIIERDSFKEFCENQEY